MTEFEKNRKIPTLVHLSVFFQRIFFQKKYKPTLSANQKKGDNRNNNTLEKKKNILNYQVFNYARTAIIITFGVHYNVNINIKIQRHEDY